MFGVTRRQRSVVPTSSVIAPLPRLVSTHFITSLQHFYGRYQAQTKGHILHFIFIQGQWKYVGVLPNYVNFGLSSRKYPNSLYLPKSKVTIWLILLKKPMHHGQNIQIDDMHRPISVCARHTSSNDALTQHHKTEKLI